VQPGAADLVWYRYRGHETGEGKNWEGPVKVGTSWGAFISVVALPVQ
jgi:hypothetical protein